MKTNTTKKHGVYFEGKHTNKRGSLCLTSKNTHLKWLHFEYRTIKPQRRVFKYFPRHETIIILLKGTCLVKTAIHTSILGPRKNVFSEKSHSVYIPPGVSFCLYSRRKSSEIAIITVPAHDGAFSEVKDISSQRVKVKKVGKDTYQRDVHTIFNTVKKGHAAYVIVGETFNTGGKWSSFPPHKHMNNNLPHEARYEEIYFFKVTPRNKFGFIRIYNEKTESVYCIKDNDCAIVTDGYHPVCTVPGSTLYYLWAMVGKHPTVINNYDNAFRDISR